MVKFIIENVSDAALESQMLAGYGIEVRYRIEDPETSEILRTGIYEVTVGSKACERTMGQVVSPEFKELWTSRLIYFLFGMLREYANVGPLPEYKTNFSDDNYAWWDRTPVGWMETEVLLGN